MIRVRDGELQLLSVLFERYKGVLYSFYQRRTGEHQLSEDLSQEVFLRILKYRDSFKTDGSFKAWLFQIARNVQMRQWKKRFSKLHVYSEEQTTPSLENSPDSPRAQPDNSATLEDDKAHLYEALEKLSPEKRQLVILKRIQNLSYLEIADLLGCEANTLKVRVHRAILELAKHLKPKMEERSHGLS